MKGYFDTSYLGTRKIMLASEEGRILVENRLSIFPSGVIRGNGEVDVSWLMLSLFLASGGMNRTEI